MSHRLAFAVLATIAFLPLRATAEVDLELAVKAAVKGSISPEGDTDTFRFEASQDAVVALTVKGKGGLDPEVTLFRPGSDEMDLSAATKFVDQGKKVLVKGLTLPLHGEYVLVVGGTGTGDYTFKITVKHRKSLNDTLTLAGLASDTFTVPAPDGADIVFTAKAARGSAAVPEFLDEIEMKATSVTRTLEDVDGPGDFQVIVHNAGAEAGDVDVSAKVKAPKVKTQKLDVRDKTLAASGGKGARVGANLDAAAGGLVEIGQGDLAGAGVSVPPGALDSDTYITVSSTSNVDVPGGGNAPAGPTVEFGPAGLSFSSPASVTIPYDPAAIPEGEDAGDVLQVVQEESDGSQSTLDPIDVDPDAGTVTVQTSGFSRFRPFVPRGRPRLSGGAFWLVDLGIEFEPDGQGGGDSRSRHAGLGVGVVHLGAEGATEGSSATLRKHEISFGHDFSPQGYVDASTDPFGAADTFTWNYGADGQTVLIGDPVDEDAPAILFVSEDGRFLTTAVPDDPAANAVSLTLLGRRPSGGVTVAELAGDFWLGLIAFSPSQGGGNALDLEAWRAFATFELAASGGVRILGDQRNVGYFGGLETNRENVNVNATLTVDASAGPLQGSLLLNITGEQQTFRVLPVDGRDVLFALPEDVGSQPHMIVLVRKSTNASRATPAGARSNTAIFIEDILTYEAVDEFDATYTLPDFQFSNVRERLTFGADGTVTLGGGVEVSLYRDPAEPSGIHNDRTSPGGTPPHLAVDRRGKVTSTTRSDPVVGAVSPDGVFLFAMRPSSSAGEVGLNVSLRLPPATVITAK